MNNRANIMYFIEHFCDMAQKENHLEFVRMMQRDILRVVDAVAPSDGSGYANVKVVRRVLNGLLQKSILDHDTVTKIEASLKERETNPSHVLALSPTDTDAQTEKQTESTSKGGNKVNGVIKVDKRQIEQRIEEDRERNKKLRESMWAVTGDDREELDKMWEEGSDIGDDDYLGAEEEITERRLMVGVD